jgi:multidrug efflux pump subunit AcrB
VVKQATDIILNTHGVEHVAPFAGLDATTSTVASNSATIFSSLPSLYNHEIPGVNANTVLADLRARLGDQRSARADHPTSSCTRPGSAGGFKMMLEDAPGASVRGCCEAANDLVAAANGIRISPGRSRCSTRDHPVYADIDRVKAEKVGITPTDVFSTLQVYLGSQYVNDFNLLGRTYEVVVQADGQYRRNQPDITRLKVRNSSGEMVPIGTVAQLKENTIPYRVPRYDLFPAAEVQGVAARVSLLVPRCPHGGAYRQVLRKESSSGPISPSKSNNTELLRWLSSAQPRSSYSSCLWRNTKVGSCRWRSF